MKLRSDNIALLFIVLLHTVVPLFLNAQKIDSSEINRTNAYAAELEDYLRFYLVDGYEQRSNKLWDRDYTSIEALVRSVEPNRERWRDVVIKPPILRKTGQLQRKPHTIQGIEGEWLELELGPVSVQAFYALPKSASNKNPVP